MVETTRISKIEKAIRGFEAGYRKWVRARTNVPQNVARLRYCHDQEFFRVNDGRCLGGVPNAQNK